MRTSNIRLNMLMASLTIACQTRPQVGTPTASPDAGSPTNGHTHLDGGVDAGSGAGGPAMDAGSTDAGSTDTTTDGNSSSPTMDAGDSQPGDDKDAGGPDGGEEVRYEVNTWGDFSALATPLGELKFLLPTDT